MKNSAIYSPTTEQLDFKDYSYAIEKFQELSEYIKKYNTLKFFDTAAACFAISNIAIQYFINEYLFYGTSNTYETYDTTNILCFINLILVILLLGGTIFIRYTLKYKILDLKYDNYRIDPNEQRLNIKLVLELFICSFFLPPYLNYSFKGTMLKGTYEYNLGEVMLLLMIPRLYLVPRLYEHYSKWTGFKAKAVCKNYATIPDAVFAIKSDMKDRSFLTIGIIFTFLVVTIGIAIMQAERHFTPPAKRNLDMSELTNNEWMIFVTMATIGYGEIFPTTHHGRFLAIIACVCGMVLFSTTTVTLNNFSQFDKEQSSAYLTIKNKQNYEKWMNSAANVIKAAIQCAKYRMGSIKRLKMAYLLKQAVFEHSGLTKLMRILSVTSSEMLRELQKQAEIKLGETKKIVFEVPRFRLRSEALSKKQEEIEKIVDKISEQQKIIFDYVSTRYPDARVPLKIGLINLAP